MRNMTCDLALRSSRVPGESVQPARRTAGGNVKASRGYLRESEATSWHHPGSTQICAGKVPGSSPWQPEPTSTNEYENRGNARLTSTNEYLIHPQI
jgi:hypothetical protein